MALVVGATGLVGSNLASQLTASGRWRVVGVSRRSPEPSSPAEHVRCDLLDTGSCASLRERVKDVTHVFYATWARRDTERENREANGAMLSNLMAMLERSRLAHVALVTGTKHYLGPFELFGRHDPTALSPFVETMPRQPVENYYYDLEDILVAEAERRGFSWSVARPNTVIGFSHGDGMNMGLTLALYASICRHLGRPFVFPGAPEQYYGLSDVTDARLLARHLEWEATEPAAANRAFNVVNGDVFRWVAMWPRVAEAFDLQPAAYPGRATPLADRMAGAQSVWDDIVKAHGLREPRLDRLASWWHTDADLGRKVECINSMGRSRSLGFMDYQDSYATFADTFERYRRDLLVPGA